MALKVNWQTITIYVLIIFYFAKVPINNMSAATAAADSETSPRSRHHMVHNFLICKIRQRCISCLRYFIKTNRLTSYK